MGEKKKTKQNKIDDGDHLAINTGSKSGRIRPQTIENSFNGYIRRPQECLSLYETAEENMISVQRSIDLHISNWFDFDAGFYWNSGRASKECGAPYRNIWTRIG